MLINYKILQKQKFNLNFGIGPDFGYGKIMVFNQDRNDSSVIKYSNNIAFGFVNNLELEYKLNSKIMFSFEINYVNMTYKPSKAELLVYTRDGISIIDKYTTIINYYNKINEKTKIKDGATSLKYTYPMNNIGISLGFKILI